MTDNADTARMVLPWGCCSHCGCSEHERIGHDDTCRYGCNDDQPEYATFDVIDGSGSASDG